MSAKDNAPITNIHSLFQKNGIERWGLAPLAYQSVEAYRNWLEKNLFGDMKYLREHLPIKENPQSHFPGLTHAIVFAASYLPSRGPITSLPIAKYANQPDYHLWFKNQLKAVCADLTNQFPQNLFLPMVDSGPILERDLAYQAGLGWIGKNTCVIDRNAGSFFFIGEILTNLTEIDKAPLPAHFHCGTCTRCLDACPTGALEEPFFLNPQKCISYWNIEAKSIPPPPLRKAVGQYFFGCDICQDVCPWNLKIHREQLHVRWSANEPALSELTEILRASHKALQRKFFGTPLSRARPIGLKRNALLVIAHHQLISLRAEVLRYRDHPELAELAAWTVAALDDL